MLKLMNDYEYQLNIVRNKYSGYKLIDHEKDIYLAYEDKENGRLWSVWFENGRQIHEIDFSIN